MFVEVYFIFLFRMGKYKCCIVLCFIQFMLLFFLLSLFAHLHYYKQHTYNRESRFLFLFGNNFFFLLFAYIHIFNSFSSFISHSETKNFCTRFFFGIHCSKWTCCCNLHLIERKIRWKRWNLHYMFHRINQNGKILLFDMSYGSACTMLSSICARKIQFQNQSLDQSKWNCWKLINLLVKLFKSDFLSFTTISNRKLLSFWLQLIESSGEKSK